jgi:hypothetical protein
VQLGYFGGLIGHENFARTQPQTSGSAMVAR